jgi:hypothetical protein
MASRLSQNGYPEQSRSNKIMNAIVSFLTQIMYNRPSSDLAELSKDSAEEIRLLLSGLGDIDQNHEMVKYVQQESGLLDRLQSNEIHSRSNWSANSTG